VNTTTGFILEEEALLIESLVNGDVGSLVDVGPDVSAHRFALSRVDNILSTGVLNGTEIITPLAYTDAFEIELSFENPAIAQ